MQNDIKSQNAATNQQIDDEIKELSKINNFINIDNSHNFVYLHLLIFATSLFVHYVLFSLSIFYWLSIITFLFGSIFLITVGLYLHRLTTKWDRSIKEGVLKLWNNCIKLSIKNYRLLREYKEIHNHHNLINDTIDSGNRDSFSNFVNRAQRITSLTREEKDTESFIIQANDEFENREKMESISTINDIFLKIHRYITLCYYLSFIKPTDEIELRHNTLYINIKNESILNKRNRKLEKTINSLPSMYKIELVNVWKNIDGDKSEKFLTIVPCKWMIYEYRNLFRYLAMSKHFKNVYSFADFNDLEQNVFEICGTIQNIFRTDIEYVPKPFINLFTTLSSYFTLMLDNYLAYVLVHGFMTGNGVFVPLLIGVVFHILIVKIISSLNNMIFQMKNPLKENVEIEKIDERIETIFTEMSALTNLSKTF